MQKVVFFRPNFLERIRVADAPGFQERRPGGTIHHKILYGLDRKL